MISVLKTLIRIYRYFISPLLPRSCRFEPSCSRYVLASLESLGYRGIIPSIVRISKCHPFHPGGYDPPKTSTKRRC